MLERLPSYALDYGDLKQAVAAVLDLSSATKGRGASGVSAG